MRTAVYTAIFGKKDILLEPNQYSNSSEIDYFCFTDNPEVTSDVYKIIHKKAEFEDITKCARFYKINFPEELSNYDFLIWHDGNLQINHNKIHDLIKILGENVLATFQHPFRSNIYDECIACIIRNKDEPLVILRQIIKYHKIKFPFTNDLYETSILVKSRIETNLFNLWWSEVFTSSKRDQISLPFVVWKTKSKVSIIPGNREDNIYSNFNQHVKPGYLLGDKIIEKSSFLKKVISITSVKLLKFILGK